MTLLHASCVGIHGRAVLITGASGAGKSDLSLRLVDRGAVLVSDDQVELSVASGQLLAGAPARIAGKLEVRGVGIVAMAHAGPMPVALLIDLNAAPDRMPEPGSRELCGVPIPAIALSPHEPSAPIKVELALREFGRP